MRTAVPATLETCTSDTPRRCRVSEVRRAQAAVARNNVSLPQHRPNLVQTSPAPRRAACSNLAVSFVNPGREAAAPALAATMEDGVLGARSARWSSTMHLRAEIATEGLLLGTTRVEPPGTDVLQCVPITRLEEKDGGGEEPVTVEAVVLDVRTAPRLEQPQPRRAAGKVALPPQLAAEMAKHGLTAADQQQLFQREGITTMGRFKSLRDANYPSNIDIAARREAKRLLDQAPAQARHDQALQAARDRHAAACLEQVKQALTRAQLTDSAPVAVILERAPDIDALRRLAECPGTLEATGVGAHDRQQLQNFCRGAGLQLKMPLQEVVPLERALTEPEKVAKRKEEEESCCCCCCFCGLGFFLLGWMVYLDTHTHVCESDYDYGCTDWDYRWLMLPVALLLLCGCAALSPMPRARVSHIQVGDEASCLEIRSKLDESAIEGADASTIAGLFSTLATEHSTCPSSGQGGLLGTFPPGKMSADFDAVIFGQRGEEGSLSVSHSRSLARSFSHSLILSLSRSLAR
eukprot:COSAG03_NODE_134_length_11903_cov_30.799729_6_plen_521_part_00